MLPKRAIDALARIAASRFGPLWVGLSGVLLCSPALAAGFGLDDHLHRILLTAPERLRYLVPPDAGLFVFAGHGNGAQTLYGALSGALPWWTSSDLLLSFWKPLSALTHRFDYQRLSGAPVLMHLHSLVWYFALVCATALLYRRLFASAAIAGLCALLYAVDDAHVMGAGWLADRNGVIAAVFVVLTVYFHDRGRRAGDHLSAVAAWLLPAPGLLASEAYVCVCGYLFAHALTLDRDPVRDRVRALVPYVAWVLGYHALYVQLGHGAHASGFFLDPGRSPLLFFASLPSRLSLLLGSHFALGSPELSATVSDAVGKLLSLLHAGVLAGIAWLAWPLLRRSRMARFLALGALLSAVPLCATLASERLLLIPGIGGMGLLGLLIHEGLHGGIAQRTGLPTQAALWGLVSVHLVLAPVATVVKAYRLPQVFAETERCGKDVLSMADMGQRHLVAFNAPDRCIYYAHVLLAERPDVTRPTTLRTLSPGAAPARLRRVDEHTLALSVEDGFFGVPAVRMFLGRDKVFTARDVLPTPALTITVGEVDWQGMPSEVQLRFPKPLDADDYRFLVFDEDGLRPISPPATSLALPAHALGIP